MPAILEAYLASSDSSAALSLSHQYQSLPYFPHALELLLHTVLDEEVDAPISSNSAVLPRVVSFLSSFPDYLDIVVQCTRKTEFRSWTTLFAYLPAPQELFQESLRKGQLKTAAGYLLILHTLEEADFSSDQCIRLLQMARKAEDYDLCKELVRFLMALDESGQKLQEAMARLEIGMNGSSETASSSEHLSATFLSEDSHFA